MELIELHPVLALTLMDGEMADKENVPREWKLPLRRLKNQSITEYQKSEGKSMGEITISVEEYKQLLKTWVATQVFSDFVKSSKYAPDREDCARFLGFALENKEEEL